jgi:hypothetical protein
VLLAPLRTAGGRASGHGPAPLLRLHPSRSPRRVAVVPSRRSLAARAYATEARRRLGKRREFAVLGGGITGLTTAHYLARHAPEAHVTLYEGSSQLGGWVEAELAQSGGSGSVWQQHGPRMLRTGATNNRYDDLVFYDVVSRFPLELLVSPISYWLRYRSVHTASTQLTWLPSWRIWA